MKILILKGSPRPDGSSSALSDQLAAGAEKMGAEVEKIFLHSMDIRPFYWFTYSAQLKTCIDRWYSLWNYKHDAFKNKPFGVILVYGDTDLYTSGGIHAIHTFETMFRFLQARVVGWVYGSLMDVGDAQKHPGLMEQAFQLGQRLVACTSLTGIQSRLSLL